MANVAVEHLRKPIADGFEHQTMLHKTRDLAHSTSDNQE